ncbi:FimD/PapC N-terminal domain-containing protein [Citrobacter rodentium NBRC 105723 = DSM 16636]|uniref:PapC N-terminal domain-containing protein n=1 Tax=Citrobacter rodentium TaxID=67825 RepID=A0A482PTD7_CITRO|nr:FimD/PapC N-terminal domain-containing protein [Citrobacter rodentium]KIQ50842.1 hypothetical protein TA05_13345 [Citrobacter rodentium]QBY31232.1 hypothetical protein E2R62_22095 [Citrobacter rodentium]UHO31405.1 FimD/PapC N-terminal domain-containing protein [Citrobacter rodentium NBRC 105723 = DSM 16636]
MVYFHFLSKKLKQLRRTGLVNPFIFLTLLTVLSAQARSEGPAVNFSRGFMKFYDSGIDLTQFDGKEKILPGDYKLDIYSNRKKIDSWMIKIISADNSQGINGFVE